MDDADYRLLTHKLLAAGIAIPFLAAIFAHAAGSRPRPVAAPPVRPALAFDQYVVNLGHVAPSEEVFAHFDFTNRGGAPVEITGLVPSCGCLQPQMKKKVYRPGESGSFSVHVQTANEKPGLKEYHIAVNYTDPEPRHVDVFFRVELPDNQVTVRPRALAFYQFGDQPTSREIEIIDRRSRPLAIKHVECSGRIAHIAMEGSEVDDSGHWHGHLRITVPGNLPPGRTESIVRIVTDDKDYRVLRVPLVIEGGSPKKFVDPHVETTGASR